MPRFLVFAATLLLTGCVATAMPLPPSTPTLGMPGGFDLASLPSPGTEIAETDGFWKLIKPAYRRNMSWTYRFTPINAEPRDSRYDVTEVRDGTVYFRVDGDPSPSRAPEHLPALTGPHAALYTVIGPEDLSVPAGMFKSALKFRYRDGVHPQASPSAGRMLAATITNERFVWFVPGIGKVKETSVYHEPDGPKTALWELVRFSDGDRYTLPPEPTHPGVSEPPTAPPIMLEMPLQLAAPNCGGVPVSEPMVSTLAGNGTRGVIDDTGAAARFLTTWDVTIDPRNSVAYVTDPHNARIRAVLPDGRVRTLAGSGTHAFADGHGLEAQFQSLGGLAVDREGNVYVADPLGHRIRKVDAAGHVTTVVGNGTPGNREGVGQDAQLNLPQCVAVGPDGSLYVGEGGISRIRKVLSDGSTRVLAVGEPWVGPDSFMHPMDIVVDSEGVVYFTSAANGIHRLTPDGKVTRVVGSGTLTYRDGALLDASFDTAHGLALQGDHVLFVTDLGGNRIRKVDLLEGVVTTVAGHDGQADYRDGLASQARFAHPTGIAVDPCGAVYVADQANASIRVIRF